MIGGTVGRLVLVGAVVAVGQGAGDAVGALVAAAGARPRARQRDALAPGRVLDVRSRYFLVTVTAAYGDAVLNLQAMLDRESNWPSILWYHTP